jgi:hypothetical protein
MKPVGQTDQRAYSTMAEFQSRPSILGPQDGINQLAVAGTLVLGTDLGRDASST